MCTVGAHTLWSIGDPRICHSLLREERLDRLPILRDVGHDAKPPSQHTNAPVDNATLPARQDVENALGSFAQACDVVFFQASGSIEASIGVFSMPKWFHVSWLARSFFSDEAPGNLREEHSTRKLVADLRDEAPIPIKRVLCMWPNETKLHRLSTT